MSNQTPQTIDVLTAITEKAKGLPITVPASMLSIEVSVQVAQDLINETLSRQIGAKIEISATLAANQIHAKFEKK